MAVAEVRDKVPVTLAGRDFVVKVVPMARIRRLADVIAQAVKDADAVDVTTQEGVQAIVDKLLQFPHRLLSLFIDNLPEDIFTDEDGGVTLPEFLHALETALTINRVDVLKNVFSRLGPSLIQASMSARTSS